MPLNYESWLKKAQVRLEELYTKRAAIDEEIVGLERGIKGFSLLVKKAPSWEHDVIGITKAVTNVFIDNPNRCFTPKDVRDTLVEHDIKLTQQNPLATIHQIISRLFSRKIIKSIENDGRTLYYLERGTEPPRKKGPLLLAAERRNEIYVGAGRPKK